MDLIWIALGFVCLIVGGEYLVRGAVAIAQRYGVSPMVIGLTLVGFGTSTPELVTSVQAAFADAPGIAVGNVVGSNIANILLILGLSALVTPIIISQAGFRRDSTALALATALVLGVVLYGSLGRPVGALLFLSLLAYLAVTFVSERRAPSAAGEVYDHEGEAAPSLGGPLWQAVLATVGGLALTILGARVLVSGAVALAQDLGVSDALIGVTIVAIGTSLPELVTSVMAARRGQSDVAFGNILGSNLFNILGILGVTALLRPIAVPPEIMALDIWVMVAATIAMIVFARSGWRIGRREGALLLASYLCYLAWLIGTVI